MGWSGRGVAATLLFGLFATGCGTDADWVGANPGRPDYIPTQTPIADCGGRNSPDWTLLMSAPPKAETYLRHAEAAKQSKEAGQHDRWYRRNSGEVLLCRNVEESDVGGYSAFWRFREKDGEVIVAESYAWQYVVVN